MRLKIDFGSILKELLIGVERFLQNPGEYPGTVSLESEKRDCKFQKDPLLDPSRVFSGSRKSVKRITIKYLIAQGRVPAGSS